MKKAKITQKPALLIITIILMILLIPFSLAEIVPVNTNNQALITNEQLNNQIQQQGLQTRNEITTYIDKKVAETISTVTIDGQNFVNENFKAFDKRMHELALKVLIQLIIGIICAIIFANALWYAIKKAINKKEEERPRYLLLDTLTAKQYGLISDEYKSKIDKERDTIVKSPVFEEQKNNPEPPTMTEIEEMMKQSEEMRSGKMHKNLSATINKATKEPKKSIFQKLKEKSEKKKIEKKIKKNKIEKEKTEKELERIEKGEKIEQEKIDKKKAELKKKLEENNINLKDVNII